MGAHMCLAPAPRGFNTRRETPAAAAMRVREGEREGREVGKGERRVGGDGRPDE